MAGDYISMSVKGATKLSNNFRADALRVDQQTFAITRQFTQLCVTAARGHASGRPGPRVVTGDLRRSITGEVRREGGTTIGIIGSNRPQARRLELGFSSTDSLGRSYHQPPYPFLRPALSSVEGSYLAALHGVVRRL